MSQRDHDARHNGTCWRCSREAVLHAQDTAAGAKGLWWCTTCQRPAFGGASSTRITFAQRLTLPRLPANKEPCQVCGKLAPLETHHLAPRAQFGEAADSWPTVEVCNDCHREWETRMGLSR